MYIFVKYKVFILVKLIIAFEYLKIIIFEFTIQKQAKNYHAKKNNTAKKLHSLYTLLNCTMLLVHKANSCKKIKIITSQYLCDRYLGRFALPADLGRRELGSVALGWFAAGLFSCVISAADEFICFSSNWLP